MTVIQALGRGFLCGLIRVYQWGISPLLPGTCRFHPTCSAYAIEAVSGHGAIRGSWLGLRRLLRCHPWGGSGFDPVPDPSGSRASRRPPAYSDHNHA